MAVAEPAREARRTRTVVALAATIGLCLRLAFSFLYWVDQPLTRDEREYLSLAGSLAAGRGFVYDADMLNGAIEPFGRAPGYPVFLSLVGGGAGPVSAVPAPVKAAQAIVGALGVVFAAMIAGRLGGSRAARLAALFAAGYPPLVWISSYAFSEALFWPCGLVLAWLFDRTLSTPRRAGGLAVATGVVLGVAVLIRAVVAPFLPMAAAWFVWRRRPGLAAAFALGAALLLVPWGARNYAHYGRVVLVATEGGVTFWTGNHAMATGDGDMAANPEIKRASQALRAEHPGLTEEQMEPVYYREALMWIQRHPGQWLVLEARKLYYFIVPVGPSYMLHSARYVTASVVSYGLLLPFAVAGFLRLGRDRARTPGLWILAGSAVLMSLAFFPQERFRISIIDPVLIVCAAVLWRRPAEPIVR